MLKEGKYLLGTISEIANELYNSEEKIFKNRFRECDFALVDTKDFDFLKESLDVIYENSIGFYGIKKIDTGFATNKPCIELLVTCILVSLAPRDAAHVCT